MLCDCCVCDHMFRLFFFKQKTAYEMRISDWSSDVCSSDLPLALASRLGHQLRQSIRTARRLFMFKDLSRRHFLAGSTAAAGALTLGGPAAFAADPLKVGRSEEHTSELQSLMRISYAVFCLKKKKNTNTSEFEHTS